ncbi:hypothetical protein NBO_11g0030 [Nosema bombycis CQ1]|uniref:Transmembrane protein n=1 Tax=Nosema bombycis (strain CQ1 / CVCC 102059) TaxID=578461 RepID=R0MQ21_NOSB1|nr:hypothetical protein NBO_11g0030 [Nosema bombycis CQ1]|eukprot:EOB14958.1 hypothetical protein NBO_11g0030 [Nosema bombycis CQ1]
MNRSLIIITYITSIFCADYLDTFEEIGPYRNINKDTLNLKITENENYITVDFISQEFIAIYGTWSTGMFKIKSDSFCINTYSVIFWLDDIFTDKLSLEEVTNTLGDYVLKHRTPKEAFYKKADNLEFSLAIFKKDDLRKLAIGYKNYLASSKPLYDFERFDELEKMLQNCLFYFGVKYHNQTNRIPENLNEYELVIYKVNTSNSFSRPLTLIKKCAIDTTVAVFLMFILFGILIFGGRYSLSKYF